MLVPSFPVDVALSSRAYYGRLGAIGLAGGLFSGLLGVGGGVVMVPLFVLWGGYRQRDAHAVSLGAIIPISAAGVLVFGAAGEIRPWEALALAAGSIVGAQAGRRLVGARRRAVHCFRHVHADRCRVHGGWTLSTLGLFVVLIAVGAGAGMLAGLLGVGGGVLLVPFLVLAVGMTQHEAEATSLLVILPTALAASLASGAGTSAISPSRWPLAPSARSAR
jgi:uncharacterized membrane protein YfcA